MMWGDGMMWGMGWAWVFWVLLILGVAVVAVVLALVLPRTPGRAEKAGPWRAREILEERYARGEISAEDFHERMRTLEAGGR